MKQGGEEKRELRVAAELRPFGESLELRRDKPRVSPDIPFGMPLGVLRTSRHRTGPRLRLGPGQNLVVGGGLNFFPGIHDQISTPSRNSFGTMACCCQCSLCLTRSVNSGRTSLARAVTWPPASVRTYSPSISESRTPVSGFSKTLA